MTQAKTSSAGTSSKKDRREHLYIMVQQRLARGFGPGPIRVFKKVLKDVEVGSTVKKVRVPVPLDYTLPAGTTALTAADKRALTEQGLSVPEITYVEGKLPEKKAKSDAHLAAFKADEIQRLRKSHKARLIKQLSADPELAASIVAALGSVVDADTTAAAAPTTFKRAATLSDKVSSLRALLDEVSSDIEAYKEAAKVGKNFDKDKLRAMLSEVAERDWKLVWFASSRMLDQAVGTPFARPKGWAKDAELSRLAATHGYKAGAQEAAKMSAQAAAS